MRLSTMSFASNRAACPMPHAALYLAAPVMALANATKYASTAYDLAVIGIALCVAGWRYGRSEALKVAVTLTSITAALVAAMLAVAGRSYLTGVASTTLTRPPGTDAPKVVLHVSEQWVGVIAVLAGLSILLAVVAAHRKPRGCASCRSGGSL